MESWRDTTFQRSILVVGVGPLSTLHSFSAAPVLIAHIMLIHVQRLTPDFRTALVALLSNLRLIVLLGLVAHFILIRVQRLTHDFRTALVALLSNLRLIILLGLIAHIILIHVKRVTHDFRTALMALLSNLRLIVLLGLIATLSAFSVLHFGLQNYRVQSLRKGARPPM